MISTGAAPLFRRQFLLIRRHYCVGRCSRLRSPSHSSVVVTTSILRVEEDGSRLVPCRRGGGRARPRPDPSRHGGGQIWLSSTSAACRLVLVLAGGGTVSQVGAEAAVPAARRRLPSQAGAARPSKRHVYGCMLREASWGRVQPP